MSQIIQAMDDYEAVCDYLQYEKYPNGFFKNQRRVLRRKCLERFKLESGVLYYSSQPKTSTERAWRVTVKSRQEAERTAMQTHMVSSYINITIPLDLVDLVYYLYNHHCLHIGGHFGRDKTVEKISSRFYWPQMTNDVRVMVQRCDVCQRKNDAKFCKETAPLHPIPVSAEVWKMVSCCA